MPEPLLHLTTQQLEYLVAVDRAETWAKAAAELNVSASALSQGLAELERRIGLPLFERDRRRRRSTHLAGEVVAYAERVLSQTQDLSRWAAAVRSGTAGSIRVGMIDLAAVSHFPTPMSQFRTERPEVTIRLTVSSSRDLLVQLAKAQIDIAVVVVPNHDTPGIDFVGLMTEDLSVYAPAGSGVKKPQDWGPWVTFPEGSHTRALIEEALIELGAPINFVADSHQPQVLCEMVRLGLGWTVLPEAQAEPFTGLVKARKKPLLQRQLALARRSEAIADPVVDALAERLKEWVSQ